MNKMTQMYIDRLTRRSSFEDPILIKMSMAELQHKIDKAETFIKCLDTLMRATKHLDDTGEAMNTSGMTTDMYIDHLFRGSLEDLLSMSNSELQERKDQALIVINCLDGVMMTKNLEKKVEQ